MDKFNKLIFCMLALCILVTVKANTPAKCIQIGIIGEWTLSIGPGGNDKSLKCDSFTVESSYNVTLKYPNIAIGQDGEEGTWTMVYNQGLEVIVAGKKYFGFFKYEGERFWCYEIEGGWSHKADKTDWRCYNGQKTIKSPISYLPAATSQPKTTKSTASPLPAATSQQKDEKKTTSFKINTDEFVDAINNEGMSWTAAKYKLFEGMTDDDYITLAGGKLQHFTMHPKAAPLTEEDKSVIEELPKSFNWKDKDGVNYVSPVRYQGHCAICFGFSALAMLEARVRIATKNKKQPVFSPQDVVDCSQYSQGCDGGFNYPIGGKYAEDFGVVLEECNPYNAIEKQCVANSTCVRTYATNYTYVGGYFGACNEARMMKAIYENGPIAAALIVYVKFYNYKKGIFHQRLPPPETHIFKPLAHGVLVVGWGEQITPRRQKYWIVKNSWGTDWGMNGYVRIRKGNNECGIEGMAFESFPIYNTDD